MNETLIAIVYAAVLSGVVTLIMLLASEFLGPHKPSPVKEEPFECGNPSTGIPRGHYPVHFYRVAILFVLFDLEIAFFYPWAVRFREYGWFGFWEMLVFGGLLVVGYVYLWAKGMLSWD